MLMAIKRQRVNVVNANGPGPEQPLHLAGARVLAVFPVLNLIGAVALAVGALSYAGTFTIAITADRDAYPDVGGAARGPASPRRDGPRAFWKDWRWLT